MATFLFVFSILIFAIFISIQLNLTLLKSVPLSFQFWIIIGYFLGLLGFLNVLFYLYKITLALAFIFIIVKYKDSYKIIFKFENLILLFYWGLLIYINYGRYFLRWDEFTHWGLAAKTIFMNDSFYWPSTTVIGIGYPPGGALLEYLFHAFSNTFSEGLSFSAFALYSSSIILSFLPNLKTKQFVYSIAFSVLLFFIPISLFAEFLSTAYVDGILGLSFAFALANVIDFKTDDSKTWLTLLISTLALILMKNTGYQFAFIVFGVYFIQHLLLPKIKDIKPWIYFLIYIISIYLFNRSWYQYFSGNTINISGSSTSISNYNNNKILTLITQHFEKSYQNEVYSNYINYFINGFPIKNINLSYLTWTLGFAITLLMVCLLFYKTLSKKSKLYVISFFIIDIGFYIYATYLLLFYLYQFDEYTALMLDSIDRYLNAYFMVLFFIFFLILAQLLSEIKINLLIPKIILLFAISVYVYPSVKSNFNDIKYVANYSKDIHEIYDKMVEFQSTLNEDDKIFFIAQNTNGFDYFAARYYFTPNVVNSSGYSFGPKYYDGDGGTRNLSVNELELEMIDYDYVYFLNVDERFIGYYNYIFDNPSDIHSNQAYKIIPYNEGKNVSLTLFFE